MLLKQRGRICEQKSDQVFNKNKRESIVYLVAELISITRDLTLDHFKKQISWKISKFHQGNKPQY